MVMLLHNTHGSTFEIGCAGAGRRVAAGQALCAASAYCASLSGTR